MIDGNCRTASLKTKLANGDDGYNICATECYNKDGILPDQLNLIIDAIKVEFPDNIDSSTSSIFTSGMEGEFKDNSGIAVSFLGNCAEYGIVAYVSSEEYVILN
jgi:hypothetical protein